MKQKYESRKYSFLLKQIEYACMQAIMFNFTIFNISLNDEKFILLIKSK